MRSMCQQESCTVNVHCQWNEVGMKMIKSSEEKLNYIVITVCLVMRYFASSPSPARHRSLVARSQGSPSDPPYTLETPSLTSNLTFQPSKPLELATLDLKFTFRDKSTGPKRSFERVTGNGSGGRSA